MADRESVLDELAARRRQGELAARPAIGPPGSDATVATLTNESGTADAPITWLFDPESFTPMGKLVGDTRYSIITDHAGAPRAMYDAAGTEVWSATVDIYGELRDLRGDRHACPFRWQGQYEDAETGLYYNRYRYFDPRAGIYGSQDPLGLVAGLNAYRYVTDPAIWSDPLGLAPITSWNDFQSATSGWFGGDRKRAAAGWQAYKESSTSTKPLAIGRLPDTEAAEKAGMQRLNSPYWNEKVNDAWVKGGIDGGKTFHMVSDRHDPDNLYNKKPGAKYPETVFKRELDQIDAAGYTEKGGCMVP
jgi:RHS repeat-associated protein